MSAPVDRRRGARVHGLRRATLSSMLGGELSVRWWWHTAVLCGAVATAGAQVPAASPTPPAPPTQAAAPAPARGCLPTGNGYLRARIRGSLNLDINWHNADLECDGGPRPDGNGVRVSFAGPPHADGRRVRMVFGVGEVHEGHTGRELPTNLTVIFEGEERLFATRGDDHCTVDELRQERVGALGGPKRAWRIVARGFCIAPVRTLDSAADILVSEFDFAGNAVFEDEPATARGP